MNGRVYAVNAVTQSLKHAFFPMGKRKPFL